MKGMKFCFGLFASLFLVFGMVSAVSAAEYKEGVQSRISSFVDHLPILSTVGENRGCASQPTLIRENYVPGSGTRFLKDAFYGSSASDLVNGLVSGLVNIYTVQAGVRSYVGEYESSDSFYFSAGVTYLLEFYQCSSSDLSRTPDGYEDGDLVCDHGVSISTIHFNNPSDYTKGYYYEEVFECGSGTSCSENIDDCVFTSSDGVRTTSSGDNDGELDSTLTSSETISLYSQIQADLEGQVVDLASLNSVLDSQELSLAQDKIAALSSLSSSVDETSEDTESAGKIDVSDFGTVIVVCSILLIVVLILGVIF